MKNSAFRFVFLAASLISASGSASASERAGRIILEDSVLPYQVQILKSDRLAFQTLRLDSDNQALISLLGSSSLSTDALLGWLEDRVQVIVGENFQVSSHTFVVSYNHSYPNPGIYPPHEVPTIAPTPGTGKTIMSNIGAGIYERAKSTGRLMGLKLEGAPELVFTSPRTGAIKVGPALFSPKHPINPIDASSIGNAIPRLGTLFHESRHSDGNGRSLCFLHAVCPPGHSMQGLYACDRNLNGPYTVGGTMTQAMTEACTRCSVAEREALRLRYLDSFGRVIHVSADGKKSTAWNPAPEGKRR